MKSERDVKRYELERARSLSQDAADRLKLAQNRKTHQEILYYMAQNDADPAVRQAVARNLATPIQASPIILRDKDVDVRLALAERLVQLLPQLTQEDYSHLYAIAVQALGDLAMDEVLNVRVALSSALKNHAFAPPAVVAQLARDIERQVAEPILRFCTALPDDVLLDILKSTSNPWAREIIASRTSLSDMLATALIESGDVSAGRALLLNQNARLGLPLLQNIVVRARQLPEWHEPLALRKTLPPEIALALADFAGDAVRNLLIKRGDFDRATREEISRIVRRRLDHVAPGEDGKKQDPLERALGLAKAGTLTETVVIDALSMRDEGFVMAAISLLAGTGIDDVKRIFALKAARPIITLSWKAGLSMRTALQLQKEIGRVPPKELIYPRDGTDYPMSEQELLWEEDFLGLKGGQALR